MTRIITVSALLAGLALSTGCVARASVGASGTYASSDPDLVYVEPGVYVVAERSRPTFYSDGYYWLWGDGYWYRSRYSDYGWVRYHNPPVAVRHIRNPRVYVNYRRPEQRTDRYYQRSVRRNQVDRVEQRDDRYYQRSVKRNEAREARERREAREARERRERRD